MIGSDGGAVTVDGVTVDVPPGALPGATTITVQRSTEPIPQGFVGYSPVYRFAPEGLRFAKPVTVRFAHGAGPSPSLYWTQPDQAQTFAEVPGGTDVADVLSATIDHFSGGFVGAGGTATDAGTDATPGTDAGAPLGKLQPVCAKSFGAGGVETVMNVGADGSGNMYVAGRFTPPLSFGGGTLSLGPMFVAKYDANCAHVWSKEFTAQYSTQQLNFQTGQMVVDAGGDIFFTLLASQIDFGAGNVTGFVTVVRLDSSGNLVWAKGHGSAGTQSGPQGAPTSIALDGSGGVFVAGNVKGDVDLGGGTLSAAQWQIFVAHYAADGSHLWSRLYGGPSVNTTNPQRAIAVDGNGDVLLTGSFYGAVDFGGGSLVNQSQPDSAMVYTSMYLAKLRGADGAHVWSRSVSSTASDQQVAGVSVSTDAAGAGIFGGGIGAGTSAAVDFGDGPRNGRGFVLKVDGGSGTTVWSRAFAQSIEAVHAVGDRTFFASLGPVDLGGGSLPGSMALGILDASGAHVWSSSWGTGPVAVNPPAVSSNGGIVLGGEILDTLDLGVAKLVNTPPSVPGTSVTDVWFARFDP